MAASRAGTRAAFTAGGRARGWWDWGRRGTVGGRAEAGEEVDRGECGREAVPSQRILEVVVREVDRNRLGLRQRRVAGPGLRDEDDGEQRAADRVRHRRQVPAEPAAPGRVVGRLEEGPLVVAAEARDARNLDLALRLEVG